MVDKPTGVLVCAILFVIGGLLIALGGLAVLLMSGVIMNAGGEDATVTGMLVGMIGIFAVIFIIIGVAELVVAYGIWKMKKWARIAGIILAIIGGVLGFPIGTIIGLIILYFLLIDKNTKDLFTE